MRNETQVPDLRCLLSRQTPDPARARRTFGCGRTMLRPFMSGIRGEAA